jgi:hypothetical protein
VKKKAFIQVILLGFLIMASIIVFVGTTADDTAIKNSYFNLKKVTDSLAITLAKHYSENENQNDAEVIADGILDATGVGQSVSPYISYTWDLVSNPKNVKVTITNFPYIPFWYKFLGKENFIFQNIESKANIIVIEDFPITSEVDDFIPLAINGCSQTIEPPLELSVFYRAYDVFNVNDNDALYALGQEGGGQSSFAQFKNTFHQGYDKENDPMQVVSTYEADADNDTKQLADAIRQNINDMDSLVGKNINIALLECASTAAHIVTQNIIPVNVVSSNCGKYVGGNLTWTDKNSDCSQTGLYRMQIRILNRNETNVILEY